MSIILECIRTVGRGERGRKPLTFAQAYQVMDEYLDGQIEDDQMAMLLMLIRVQNETRQEIAGFVKAFQSRVPNLGADVDWPCYAGKRPSAGKPWHLLAAKILARQGYKVLLHGYNDKPAEREHAEHYLPSLNIAQAASPEQAKSLLEAQGIAYLALKDFAPIAEKMIGWKNRYGLRSPINTVVRALNPGGAKVGLRGSFHPGFQQLHAEVEQEIGQTSHGVISFKGQSGESEFNPKVSQTVWLSSPEGVSSHYWTEQMLSDIPTVARCPFDTPPEEKNLMANTVVATLAAVLFTELNDREVALENAHRMWREYCAAEVNA
ncbi:glycosyl transferase family protein [Vibrio navarrensis]|uniref:Glycosyl transferase family protein n=1 Tax=Vibrio navarrensis TaxID=29495 RepID=A0AAI9CTV0_9VIBR|nr:glycosyl transferase family protein [Vibrio navarrensis]EJL6395033.1 glycosyl transferase family protein [Vibrio navarrensis]ELN6932478.1 glycosyl transferase family protein [Vibrio navarrensis]